MASMIAEIAIFCPASELEHRSSECPGRLLRDEQFLTSAHRSMLTVERVSETLLERLISTQHALLPKPLHRAADVGEPIIPANEPRRQDDGKCF